MIISDLNKIRDNQGSTCGDSSRISSDICTEVVNEVTSIESESSVSITPSGSLNYIPCSVNDTSIPFTNQIFDSLDKGYKFYKNYGRLGGFTIRKTTEKTYDDGRVLLKYFVCSCEGFNDLKDDANPAVKKMRIVSRRCGCKAKMILKYMFPDKYIVKTFVELHNHPLADKNGRQFLRVNREMDISLRNLCYNGAKVNIGSSKMFSFAKEMYGGYANVGANLRDFRNFSRGLKLFIGDNDAQMIIDKFKRIQQNSEGFYFAFDVDSSGHLNKLFWSDVIGRRNFQLYGDAVSFDATFDTNRYNMIFAPFTSVDKHYRCVTFAACLLSHESIVGYSWAFDHLVKVMGRNSVVIVTDQCPAMKVAVRDIFSEVNGLVATKHRLCM
ncbi:protein FAR1-RELATED SEQUENCE 5-like [Apium graveolens]|uniref:protein FAR1-RELATED SEQUENCE 5-like n=1 Tax=Apium graveolens TaxID=4045 RepID=UPI003D7AA470